MMKKLLISLMFVLLFVLSSCGGSDTGDTGDCSGDFPNYHKGLCWSDVLYNRMNWDEAIAYCKNIGGRLPTISELRTLIQNCPGTETGGECGVTDSCLSEDDCWNDPCSGCEEDESGKYSVFGDTRLFWSSSELSEETDRVWELWFAEGAVGSNSKDDPNGNLFRCVR